MSSIKHMSIVHEMYQRYIAAAQKDLKKSTYDDIHIVGPRYDEEIQDILDFLNLTPIWHLATDKIVDSNWTRKGYLASLAQVSAPSDDKINAWAKKAKASCFSEQCIASFKMGLKNPMNQVASTSFSMLFTTFYGTFSFSSDESFAWTLNDLIRVFPYIVYDKWTPVEYEDANGDIAYRGWKTTVTKDKAFTWNTPHNTPHQKNFLDRLNLAVAFFLPDEDWFRVKKMASITLHFRGINLDVEIPFDLTLWKLQTPTK